MSHDLGDPLGSLSSALAQHGLLSAGRLTGADGVGLSHMSPHATTIVATVHSDGMGAVMAADRRASQGHRIAHEAMTKLYLADRASTIGIAGAAGLGVELARLFALELEHVEKIERAPLSHGGKVRRLSILVQTHLGLALQGLSAVPILVGFDAHAQRSRIHTFDPTGGAYEESSSAALGSGGDIARAVLDAALGRGETSHSADPGHASRAVLRALGAAAERDSATSGLNGAALPLVVEVDAAGARFMSEMQVRRIAEEVRGS